MSIPSQQNTVAKPHGLFHDVFDIVVVLKGLNGFAEIAVGQIEQSGMITGPVNNTNHV